MAVEEEAEGPPAAAGGTIRATAGREAGMEESIRWILLLVLSLEFNHVCFLCNRVTGRKAAEVYTWKDVILCVYKLMARCS
jgi:hypothetical protein